MRHLPLLATFLLFSAAPSWAAPFNGTLELKMPGGTATVSIGEAGVLTDMQMTLDGATTHIKSLFLKQRPDVFYVIQDSSKTYSEFKLHFDGPADAESWAITKLGTETVAGFPCVHVKAASTLGKTVELWLAPDVMSSSALDQALGQSSGLTRALEAAGVSGFPAKTIQRDGQNLTRMELVRVTRDNVTPAMVSLPAGYQKGSPTAEVWPSDPDVQRRKLDEAMKQLTPEQRAALQKAMGQ